MTKVSCRAFSIALVFTFCVFFATGCAVQDTEPNDSYDIEEDSQAEEEYVSIDSLEALAEGGDGTSAYELGVIYDYGTSNVSQNLRLAKQWYEKAREYGYTPASLALGYIYLNGADTSKDYDFAKELFTEAIDAGIVDGKVGMGRLLMTSDYPDRNYKEAFKLFQEANNEGSLDGKYFYSYAIENHIGNSYGYGRAISGYLSVVAEESKAILDQFAINAANTRLGIMHIKGKGVDVDRQKALEFFTKASDNGFVQATYYLGLYYESGFEDDFEEENDTENDAEEDDEEEEISPDYETAFSYYEMAASKGYAPALNKIGYLYCNGLGVDVDYSQALYYQKMAASQGYAPAQINLGYLYEYGLGVPKDLNMALSYYRLADASGYRGAKSAIVRVEQTKENERSSYDKFYTG